MWDFTGASLLTLVLAALPMLGILRAAGCSTKLAIDILYQWSPRKGIKLDAEKQRDLVEHFENIEYQLPPATLRPNVLSSIGDSCFCCGGRLREPIAKMHAVWTPTGLDPACVLLSRVCTVCKADHRSDHIRTRGNQHLVTRAHVGPHGSVTTQRSVFTNKLLREAMIDIFATHTRFFAFAHAYNLKYSNRFSKDTTLLDSRQLMHAIFVREYLVRVLEEPRVGSRVRDPSFNFGDVLSVHGDDTCTVVRDDGTELTCSTVELEPVFDARYGLSPAELDSTLWSACHTSLLPDFRQKWTRHAGECGAGDNCKKAIIADGHFKWRRACCDNDEGGFIECPVLGHIAVPCTNWPGHRSTICTPCCENTIALSSDATTPHESHDDVASQFAHLQLDDDVDPEPAIDDTQAAIQEAHSSRSMVGRRFIDEGEEFIVKSVRPWKYTYVEDGKLIESSAAFVSYYRAELTAPGGAYYNKSIPTSLEHPMYEWSPLSEVLSWLVDDEHPALPSDAGTKRKKSSSAATRTGTALRATRASLKAAKNAASPEQPADDDEDPDERATMLATPEGRKQPATAVILAVIGIVTDPANRKQKAKVKWSNNTTSMLDLSSVPEAVLRKHHAKIKLAREGKIHARKTEDRGATCESTDKEFQRKESRKTTAGILMFVYNCGIIFDICELYGSESASQVYARLVDLIQSAAQYIPHLMFYDDGCGLRKFAELRAGVNRIAAEVWHHVGQHIYIDRLHWKNHKKTPNNDYCWKHCDPGNLPDAAKSIDTERCEQTFSWLARYKHTARYLRPGHFLFFMLVLCDMKNKERCATAAGAKRQF